MWSKFKTISCLNIWKKGITYNSSLKITHVTDWVANWLGWVASGGTRGGSLSIFLFHPFPFLYLSIGWVEFIICCEDAAHDKHTSRRIGLLYHWEWMNNLMLTRPREENTCSAGLGWLATCREGWEFLQQEGWGDGDMDDVEEEEEEEAKESPSPCVYSALTLTWRWCWHIVLLSNMAKVSCWNGYMILVLVH